MKYNTEQQYQKIYIPPCPSYTAKKDASLSSLSVKKCECASSISEDIVVKDKFDTKKANMDIERILY